MMAGKSGAPKLLLVLWQGKLFNRLLNLSLRGATLISKLLLILFLAKFLAPAELGLYGLVVAAIGYALYLVGLDFYTYTTREIIKRGSNNWGDIVKGQISLTAILYFFFLPLIFFALFRGVLPLTLAIWFFALLVLEHVAQELNRILIALSAQLVASLVLFLRSGLWAIVAVVIMYLDAQQRNLSFVLLCWVIGGVGACGLSILYLSKVAAVDWRAPINWPWVRRGVYVALPLLASTLSIRGVFTLDRYWLEHYAGLELVGAYVLYMGVANALISFLDAGVFVYTYPALIKFHNSGEAVQFRRQMKRLYGQCMFVVILFVLTTLLSMPYVLLLLEKQIYWDQGWMLSWILLAMVLFALGMIPQYGLYAQGKDKHIVISHAIGLAIFVIIVFSVPNYSPSQVVLFGLVSSFGASAFWKLAAYQLLSPADYLLYKFKG